MNIARWPSFFVAIVFLAGLFLSGASSANAALTLTAGNNATTTPNVATSITGFQIVGPAASTTPVRLRATSGTLSMTTTTGLTFNGASSGSTVNFSGTVSDINNALSTLKYTRSSTGTDTLEVSLVEAGEVFFSDNGHLYKFITGTITASAARTAATTQTAYGATGYLATITSQAENDFVADRLQGDGWMGASDEASEGQWRWVTGPEAGTLFWTGASGGSVAPGQYANWSTGEPNDWLNGSPGEDCAQFYISTGKWNDLNCTGSSLTGYVVEFGAPGNMPTVVATNISVVTADVPAITTLSPSNGSSLIDPAANLVISFSKTVTKQTGNILIRKMSDDSIVETIDVSSGLVTGGGTNSITINPLSNLPEGTQLYVTIPGTAFKDASNNFFDGFLATSTWTFTTNDVTAPVISNIASSTGLTSATITWNTNEAASTRLWYSANLSYASSTSEINTISRVTSHSVGISDLLECTLYHFRAVSRDSFTNSATSTGSTFMTTGCAAGLTPSAATSTLVLVNSTASSTLSDTGRTLAVVTPANFTATSSSVTIQIKALNSELVLGTLGKPNSVLQSGSSVAFDVKALINNVTELDSFNTPVTISYTYTNADVELLDESTLVMYHYRNGIWEALDNCSVNTAANTITCTAPHFSVFAIFGSIVSAGGDAGVARGASLPWCSSPLAPGWNSALADGGCSGVVSRNDTSGESSTSNFPLAAKNESGTQLVTNDQLVEDDTQDACQLNEVFTKRLQHGSRGPEVKNLQRSLNCLGFSLAESGPGSLGNETEVFAHLTKQALTRFQNAYASEILLPLGLQKGTGVFAAQSRAKMQVLITQRKAAE